MFTYGCYVQSRTGNGRPVEQDFAYYTLSYHHHI